MPACKCKTAPRQSARGLSNVVLAETGRCVACPYHELHVPRSVAWRLPGDERAVRHIAAEEFAKPPAPRNYTQLYSYWEEVAVAAGGRDLRTVCGRQPGLDLLPGTSSVQAWLDSPGGAFVVFRGDSFLRNTFHRLVQLAARDQPHVQMGMDFTYSTFGDEAVLCCAPSTGGRNCTFLRRRESILGDLV